MPEEQKPFIHEPSPDARHDAAVVDADARLLAALMPHNLAEQAGVVDALVEELDARLGDLRISSRAETKKDMTDLRRTSAVLVTLQQPTWNTIATAFVGLDPLMRALIADVALALGNAGAGRQNLAIALRKLIEGRS